MIIIVAGPFLLILLGLCVSLLKSIRHERFEATLRPKVRHAVEHAEKFPDI